MILHLNNVLNETFYIVNSAIFTILGEGKNNFIAFPHNIYDTYNICKEVVFIYYWTARYIYLSRGHSPYELYDYIKRKGPLLHISIQR